jgi:fibronectin type 3 domain-containing protein
VTWTPPSLNTDGSALTDVVGYRIYYGTDAANLDSSLSVSGGTTTSAVISGLNAATYYFALAALNSTGAESAASNPVSRTFP